MAYRNNIPLQTDQYRNSQNDILDNFQQINAVFNVNHGSFGSADIGRHRFIQFSPQGAAPATGATEIALYSAVGAISGVAELVFKRHTGPATVIPFTEGDTALQGWTRLPSGLVIKWNTVLVSAIDANNNVILNLPLNGPVLNTLFWGAVFPQADPGNTTKDINAAPYVTALSSAQIDYKIWRRNIFNTPGTNQGPLVINGFLLGIE